MSLHSTVVMPLDSLIIGAGVAGLAAACRLHESGANIEVLEARDRIGGRIFTVRDERCAVPIELGAEFIHGAARETMDIVNRARLRAVDVTGEHWQGRNGQLRRVKNFFRDVDLVLRRIDPAKPDESFASFLARKPGGRTLARKRKFAAEFVEGFHNADSSTISAHALADEGSPGADTEMMRQGRVIDGYDRVPQTLAEGLSDRVNLSVQVQRLEWRRGHVTAHTTDGRTLTARTAIVTVPIGVLHAVTDPLIIDPPMAAVERTRSLLHMGTVLRVALLFSEPFWEHTRALRNGEAHAPLSFVHAAGQPIPVWWTPSPARAPLLTGWAGGPKASALLAVKPDQLERIALDTIAHTFDINRATLTRKLEGAWTHDWQRDEFTRGSYSYPGVGGADAARLLSTSAARTVFMAGEACEGGGRNGTVDGAIATGYRAARRVLSALND